MDNKKIIAVVSLDNKVIQKQYEFPIDITDKEIDEIVKSWADSLVHSYWIEVNKEEDK